MIMHPQAVAQMAAGVSPGKTVASTDLPYWMLFYFYFLVVVVVVGGGGGGGV